ncbi:MAG: hypothetical protein AB7S75_02385 [Desulfococcaceae bacterium]
MSHNIIDRRSFIRSLPFFGLMGMTDPLCLIRNALAMGSKDFPQGFNEIKGDVRLNGIPAQVGAVVKYGDTVTTGQPESRAVFVVGQDAYLLRENTHVEIRSADMKEQTADFLRVVRGKMLAVFGKGNKRIEMPTAIAGIRGTGMYTEAEPERTYICTCYGVFDIHPVNKPEQGEHLIARHHEYPRYIYASGDTQKIISPAPMINHTDAELILLESLVGRKPPFATREFKDYQGQGGNGGGY